VVWFVLMGMGARLGLVWLLTVMLSFGVVDGAEAASWCCSGSCRR
jgi:hypothetical protein